MNNVYRIKSGSLDVEIKSSDHKAAAIAAVKTYQADSLGQLMEITLVGGDPGKDGWYMSAERVLQDAGITYKRNDGQPNMEPRPSVQ